MIKDAFRPGDQVEVKIQDWQRGEMTMAGRVTRVLSRSHVRVLIGDRAYAVAMTDCRLLKRPRRKKTAADAAYADLQALLKRRAA